jgi:hypothetical protein
MKRYILITSIRNLFVTIFNTSMKKSLLQVQRDRLFTLYCKLTIRLKKHFSSHRFHKLTKQKQHRLLKKLEDLKQKMFLLEKRAKLAGITFLATTAISTIVEGQSNTLETEFQVNTFTADYQNVSSVAMDNEGDFVIAWTSKNQDGSGYGIYAQRYNLLGVTQETEFRVNTYTTGNQKSPFIAMDNDGDFIITWESLNQDGNGYGIYAQRYNSLGNAQGAEFKINSYTTADQRFPSVDMDNNGAFIITWQSNGQDGSGEGIYAQRYNALGVAQGIEFRVNSDTTNSQRNAVIAMDNDGDFVITWQSENLLIPNYGIYAQRYSAAGIVQGPQVTVSSVANVFPMLPDIAIDSDGNFVITWQRVTTDGIKSDVYARRYSSIGNSIGSEFRVNTYTTNTQSGPFIAMDSDGDFVISWGSDGQDGSSYGIYAQQYNTSGVAQGTEFRVNTFTSGQQWVYSIDTNGDEGFIISWISDGQDGSNFGVYAQLYVNAAPSIFPQTFSIAEDINIGSKLGSVVALDANIGQAITYAISSGNSDGKFNINSSTGEITIAGTLDFETSSFYNLTIQVTDNGTPSKNTSAIVTIYVTDVSNENNTPFIVPQTFTIAENSLTGISVGTIAASDADATQTLAYSITAGNTAGKFFINSNTGEITIAGTLDFETTSSYNLTIQVMDNGTPSKNASATITINVTDVSNENTPTISPQTFSIAENSANGTSVGTVSASDADATQTLTYSITTGNADGKLSINNSTGEITVAATLDFETTNSYSLTVLVADNGTLSKNASATITINVTDVSNENTPTISPQTFSIAENSANTTSVGTVTASDADATQTLTYSITAGNAAGKFSINSSTGEIIVAESLDYETTTSYTLTVQVTDNGSPNKNASATITINVTDAVETGIISGLQTNNILLHPNPANETVAIELQGETSVRIIDLTGNIMREILIKNSEISLEGLKAGIYIIELTQNDQKVLKKLVVE